MDTESRESGREDAKVEVSCTCPFCEREIPPECIEVKVKEDIPECQYIIHYEGYDWCNLSDNPCFKDTGECDEYNDLLKEVTNENKQRE